MSDFQIDLSNCDREPIHIPGQIQSHGFLIVLNKEYSISYFSENAADFISGVSEDILGLPLQYLESLIDYKLQPSLITQLLNIGKVKNNFEQTNPTLITISAQEFYLVISTSATYYLLEFEPATTTIDLDIQKLIGRSLSVMLSEKNLQNLLNNTAVQVKNIINYDRVMIYRFAEDGHGEVKAESKDEQLVSWLGLHYPASDIPKQARELYKINLTRLIADVNTPSSNIITNATNQHALDLTHAQLRAVSPIHIQYLKNMGVASSFSISLIYKDELWGLISCHNYTPRFIDYKSRESAKLIGQILSSALEFRQDEENHQLHEEFKYNLDIILKYLQKNTSIEEALTQNPVNILNLVHAGGAVLVYEKNIIKLGRTPDDKQLEQLISWIQEKNSGPIYSTNALSALFPEAAVYRDIASGMLVSVLSKTLNEYVIWFKPEKMQTINWAGNPEKPIEQNENGLMQISPRNSFEVWIQTVAGKSDYWSVEEIKSVLRLKEEITYAINQKAGTLRLLNEKLQQAYEELDKFSYTISHDLKNPLSAVKSYAQLLLRESAITERGQKLLLRIEDRANQMNQMISEVLEYSRIGRSVLKHQRINTGELITNIINDLDTAYDADVLTITVGETPDLQGDPFMLSQVFSNLIGNAIKYSQRSIHSEIHIQGLVNQTEICYTIKDNGLGIADKDLSRIFELFSRMDNVKDIEGTGVGLAIVKQIIDKHKGKVWVESELGMGSTFYLLFDNKLAFLQQ